MAINPLELSSLKKIIQSNISSPASFLIKWQDTMAEHLDTLESIIHLYEEKKDSNTGEGIYQIITDNVDTLFRYPLFMSHFHHDREKENKLQDLIHRFDKTLYINAYNEFSTLSNSLNSKNLIPVLSYLKNYGNKEYIFKCHNLVMSDYNQIYSSLSLKEKGHVIDLLNAITVSYVEGYDDWKKTQMAQGILFSYDLNVFISQMLNSYNENQNTKDAFKKMFSNKELSLEFKQHMLDGLMKYDWNSEYVSRSGFIFNTLLSAGEYRVWIDLVNKLTSVLEQENNDSRRKCVPINGANLKDIIEYVVKEGSYEDLLSIKYYLSKDNYDFNYGAWYKNEKHDLTQSPLYELALRGKKLEFNLFLEQYKYINQTHEEYFKGNNYNKKYSASYSSSAFLLKDELESLMNVLNEYQEYAMLDCLKQFKEKYCPTPFVQEVSHSIEHKVKRKNFLNLFAGLFSKNKNAVSQQVNESNSELKAQQNTTLISQLPQNHAEFIRELNSYSKAQVEKLNFLSRKVKINIAIESDIKTEICSKIDSILQNSLMIEKILEKEYSTRYVEEYVRYKSLTGKYFVQAVERYLNINAELKQELKESSETTTHYLEQFREQVNFIQTGLEEIKTQLKNDRQNDLLMDMQSDTQLLRLKQHG